MPKLGARKDLPRSTALAQLVTERRIALGYTQDDVARIAGIHKPTYVHIEMGRTAFPRHCIGRLAKALNLALDELAEAVCKPVEVLAPLLEPEPASFTQPEPSPATARFRAHPGWFDPKYVAAVAAKAKAA